MFLCALVEPCVGQKCGGGHVFRQLQVIDGKNSFWVLVGEDTGLYGGAEY